ncbi:MAG: Lon-like protease helical domain-containing protein [Polyangiales bacterium]
MTIRLDDDRLHRPPASAELAFASSDDLEDLPDVVGQLRATEALRFGLGIRRKGFNLFVLGSQGTGRHSMVRRFVQQRAETEPIPEDWVYVHDFGQPAPPQAIRMPTGRARALQSDVDAFLKSLPQRLETALQSEVHRNRRRALEQGWSGGARSACAPSRSRPTRASSPSPPSKTPWASRRSTAASP